MIYWHVNEIIDWSIKVFLPDQYLQTPFNFNQGILLSTIDYIIKLEET